MHDQQTTALLQQLAQATPPPEVESAALQRMLDSFDNVNDVADAEPWASSAERRADEQSVAGFDRPSPPDHAEVPGRSLRWQAPLLAAAAVAAIVILAASLIWARGDTPDRIVTASTAESVATESAGTGASIPRQVVGEYAAELDGVTISFNTDTAIWLTSDDSGVLEFVTDHALGDEAERTSWLTLSVASDPVAAVGNDLAGFLRTDNDALSGQITPLTVDDVPSVYWRGGLQPDPADPCLLDGPQLCLTLYNQPRPIGLTGASQSAHVDVVARTIDAERTLVMIAELHANDYSFDPLGPFTQILTSIEIDDGES